MKIQKICISCPAGCHLDIETRPDGSVHVEGNGCKRGVVYAENEIHDPKRILTATVAVRGENLLRLPVKTDRALSKKKIPSLLRRIYSREAVLPVHMGDVFLENADGDGCNLVFTRSSDC